MEGTIEALPISGSVANIPPQPHCRNGSIPPHGQQWHAAIHDWEALPPPWDLMHMAMQVWPRVPRCSAQPHQQGSGVKGKWEEDPSQRGKAMQHRTRQLLVPLLTCKHKPSTNPSTATPPSLASSTQPHSHAHSPHPCSQHRQGPMGQALMRVGNHQ